MPEPSVARVPTMEIDFRDFVVARSAALLRTAYLLTGDWATAEDLLQTALAKTYLAWKRLGEIEAVEPYVRRVLVNTATSWWRRRWHGERPTEVLPERAIADGHDVRLERDVLWQFVRALPVRQRAVLVLRFYEDLSEAQTAAILGVSVGTVKSQCSRALATLRQRLSTAGLEPLARAQAPDCSSAPGRSTASGRRPSSGPATPAAVPAPAAPTAPVPAAAPVAPATAAVTGASGMPVTAAAPGTPAMAVAATLRAAIPGQRAAADAAADFVGWDNPPTRTPKPHAQAVARAEAVVQAQAVPLAAPKPC